MNRNCFYLVDLNLVAAVFVIFMFQPLYCEAEGRPIKINNYSFENSVGYGLPPGWNFVYESPRVVNRDMKEWKSWFGTFVKPDGNNTVYGGGYGQILDEYIHANTIYEVKMDIAAYSDESRANIELYAVDANGIQTQILIASSTKIRSNLSPRKVATLSGDVDVCDLPNTVVGRKLMVKVIGFNTEIDNIRVFANNRADAASIPKRAKFPRPMNQCEKVARQPVLKWESGLNSRSHDIYIGKGYEDVLNATRTNGSNIFRGNQATTNYTIPEELEPLTPYYWRVDELADNGVEKGPVWMFITGVGSKMDGYYGIWDTASSYYTGGLGTYCSSHIPLAVYSPVAQKTFFVYGGTVPGKRHLLAMASYYDHKLDIVPKPTVVHDWDGKMDAHCNPVIAIDNTGYIWVFVSGHGGFGFKYRSIKPYDVANFELVESRNFTYPQPWWIDGKGFLLLFTKYGPSRELYWSTSTDGFKWSTDKKLAGMGGHYQVSCPFGSRIGTAFNVHINGNPDTRTNLYYVETDDMGKTWKTASGKVLPTPITDMNSVALVHNFRKDGLLVYVADITFDCRGNPVILVVTARHHLQGPQGNPRTWTIAHWTGNNWVFSDITTSTNNYDTGSLYIEKNGIWRLIGPTAPGPQYWGTGGEVVMWESKDDGLSWRQICQLTSNSPYNNTYVRRPLHADPNFYAFWADGNAEHFSESKLYFCNKEGKVRILPEFMKQDTAIPKINNVISTSIKNN